MGHHPADGGVGVIENIKGYLYGYLIGALVALIFVLVLDLPPTIEGLLMRFLIIVPFLFVGGKIGERVITW